MKISKTPTTQADIDAIGREGIKRLRAQAFVTKEYLEELARHEKVTTYGPQGSDVISVTDRLVREPGREPRVERDVKLRPSIDKIALTLHIGPGSVVAVDPAAAFRAKAHAQLGAGRS